MTDKIQGTTDVKESIILICRMLKYSDIYPNLSPDHIRQAKFDKPEVITILVEVLHAVIQYDTEYQVSNKHLQWEIIINALKQSCYPRLQLLLDEKKKFHSSREILLAISWYFHCSRTCDRVKNMAAQPIDILDILSTSNKKTSNKRICGNSSTMSKEHSIEEKMNYISWLVSQIRSLENQIISTESGNACKKFKVTSSSSNNLQQDQLLLVILRYPTLQSEFERNLERKILLLQSCIKWKNLQHSFWIWMDSVLVNAPSLQSVNHSVCEIRSTCRSSLLPVFEKNLIFLQKELEKNLQIFNERPDMLSSLQPEQKAEIDKEMNLLHSLIRDPCHQPKLKRVKENNLSAIDHLGHGVEKTIPLSECSRVKTAIDVIDKELKDLRLNAKEKLMHLNCKFPEVVLIPPDVTSRKLAISKTKFQS